MVFCRHSLEVFLALFILVHQWRSCSAGINIDGGRSELPGMKQDMFDQAKASKQGGGRRVGQGPPDCPKSDGMSAFAGLAFVSGEVYVKLNTTEEPCQKLLMIGGVNTSVLFNASRTCGPAGEWKKRIAEDMSALFFQAGLEWVKHDGDFIEVVVEDGTYQIPVTEAKHAEQVECWARGCGCEQSKNPIGRIILFTLLAIGVGGMSYDTGKHVLDKFSDKKPPKSVLCKRGHKLVETRVYRTRYCDICSRSGTCYQCSESCPFDLCKTCYKSQKKSAKAKLEAWYEKHPGDRKVKSRKGAVDNEENARTETNDGVKSEGETSNKDTQSRDTSGQETPSKTDKNDDDDGEDTEGRAAKEESENEKAE